MTEEGDSAALPYLSEITLMDALNIIREPGNKFAIKPTWALRWTMKKEVDWIEFERALKVEIRLAMSTRELDGLYWNVRGVLDIAKPQFSLYYDNLIDQFKARKKELNECPKTARRW